MIYKLKVKSFCASAALLTAFALSPVSAMAADVPAAAAQQQSTALAATTTGSMLPSDVLTNDDGTELKKIYDVAKTVSPAQIPTEDFDRGGLHYIFSELLKIDMPETDHKTHSEQVSVSSSSNSASDVLSLLPKSKAIVTTDGYTGTAYLDTSSISSTAGTTSVTSDLSATREYPNLTDMDMSSIPKSITENGNTLQLADVEWKESMDETDNFGTVSTTYTAVVKYTGSVTSTKTTGYTITATYSGDLTRRNDNKVRYIALYTGSPIVQQIEIVQQPAASEPETAVPDAAVTEPAYSKPANRLSVSWVLCGVFGILMLIFALRPPMCRRMMRQMQFAAQQACGRARDGITQIKTETERRKHEKAEKQAKDDEEERKRQQIFGPLDKLKAAIRSRRKRKSLPIAALTAPVDEEQDGNVENATEPECSDEPAPDAAPECEPGADVEPEDAPAIEPDEIEDGEYAGMDKSFRIEPSDAYRPRRDDGADDDGEYPGIRF